MKQILDYTDEELAQLVKKLVKDGQVVLYEQKLTMNQYADVLTRMGEVEELDYFMNPKEERRLSYVSGQVDKDGYQIGMFGDQELQWHANGTGRYNFKGISSIGQLVDVITFELTEIPRDIKDRCNALLPELTAIANFVPIYSANSSSNFETLSPPTKDSFLNASIAASSISCVNS